MQEPTNIRTRPFEEGTKRFWKADNCPLARACIKAGKESMKPDICGKYANIDGKESCSYPKGVKC